MNSIELINFRRFARLPKMNLGDITLLVGGNNSGKSSLIKAYLLCVDNLCKMTARTEGRFPNFRFDANEWHDVKVKTFRRAHSRHYYNGDDGIHFGFTLYDFHFRFSVYESAYGVSSCGSVFYVQIHDLKNRSKYEFNFANGEMTYTLYAYLPEPEYMNYVIDLHDQYLTALEEKECCLNQDADSERLKELDAKIWEAKQNITLQLAEIGWGESIPTGFDIEKGISQMMDETGISDGLPADTVVYTMTTSMSFIPEHSDQNLMLALINSFLTVAQHPGEDENRQGLQAHIGRMEQTQHLLSDMISWLNEHPTEYINAHAVHQNSIYDTNDRNDYLAQTIHEYVRTTHNMEEIEDPVIRNWMLDFGIGKGFRIEDLGSEAYRVWIYHKDSTTTNLADMGRGAIQLMMLFFRLQTISSKFKLEDWKTERDCPYYPIVLIEEPEQNLHPKMQSLLTNLFYWSATTSRVKFIIETHSEYLIRKSQVLVKEDKYETQAHLDYMNPFKVYYFSEERRTKQPSYALQYRPDGTFANDFGPGFFDEAERLAFNII